MYFLISCVWKTICSQVWAHHVSAWRLQSLEESTRLPGTGVMSILWATLWVLGIHPGSFLRVTSSSHHWPISPAPDVYFVGLFYFLRLFFFFNLHRTWKLPEFFLRFPAFYFRMSPTWISQVSFARCHPTGSLRTLCASHLLNCLCYSQESSIKHTGSSLYSQSCFGHVT